MVNPPGLVSGEDDRGREGDLIPVREEKTISSRDCVSSARLPRKSAASTRKSRLAVDVPPPPTPPVHIRASVSALPGG